MTISLQVHLEILSIFFAYIFDILTFLLMSRFFNQVHIFAYSVNSKMADNDASLWAPLNGYITS